MDATRFLLHFIFALPANLHGDFHSAMFHAENPYSQHPYSLTFKYAVDTLRAVVPISINLN